MTGLTEDDVSEILRLIDDAGPTEVRVETAGLRLHIVRGDAPGPAPAPAPAQARPAPPGPEPAAPEPAAAPSPPPAASATTVPVPSPMIGVWYVAEAPGKPPFVQVGDRVEPDTVVGIVEVMKMMNSVEAGVRGTVAEICVGNAEMVEEGQPLVLVEPS